jgi:hypothetical protein
MTRTQIEKQVWTMDNNHPVVAVNKLLKQVRELDEAIQTVHVLNGVKGLSTEQLKRLMTARTVIKFAK